MNSRRRSYRPMQLLGGRRQQPPAVLLAAVRVGAAAVGAGVGWAATTVATDAPAATVLSDAIAVRRRNARRFAICEVPL